MPITSTPSTFLRNKSNLRAIGNRLTEATAEDFKEIADLFTEVIGVLNAITGPETPNAFYGVHSSLALLMATYPTAVAGGYANIDSGVGEDVRIALWDSNDDIWVLQQTTATTTQKTINVNDSVTDKEVTDNNGNLYLVVSGTYLGPDTEKLESYSANSITREL